MSLNIQQQKAVEHGEGPLLIVAGAGSGKTRVLTHRIAHLIEKRGVAPQQILAVTFTNKAAREMMERLEGLVGGQVRNLWIGTFHSLCLKILRKHAEALGLNPRFAVFDDADQRALLKQILSDLNLDEKKFPPSSLVARISRYKDQLMDVAAVKAEARDPYSERMAKVYTAYEAALQKLQVLDFGDLIFKTVRLLETHADVLARYQKFWRYLLVDEYQDTNHAQYRWLKNLAGDHHNITVVGDPDQSIYAWRGADISNILNFEKDFPGATVVYLEQNYRSTQNILSAAQAVIVHNTARKEKNLWSTGGAGAPITVAALPSEREEAQYVVKTIEQFCKAGGQYKKCAIFYRTNAQSRALEEVLQQQGVPYVIFGGIRFYERAEIKNAIAYFKALLNPSDDISLKRVINVPPRGIGKTTIEKVEATASAQQCSFYEACRLHGDHPKLTTFWQWFEGMRKVVLEGAEELAVIVRKVLEESGMIRQLMENASVEAEERLSNLNELVAAVAEFSQARPEATLSDYLDQVALVSDLDQAGESGVVSLMTLHLAKGLEFPWVAVVGLEEGLLPHSRSMNDPGEIEEERRLLYVGMTRAKEKLVLTQAWRRYLNGNEQYGLPSRFLDEIPEQYLEKVAATSCHSRATSCHSRESGNRNRSPIKTLGDDDFDWDQSTPVPSPSMGEGRVRVALTYPIGLRVRHPEFGLGQIAHCEKTSQGEKVTVKFFNGLTKKLIAEYARLERV